MSGSKECERVQQLISAMLDGELSAGERTEMEKHIATCDECSAMCVSFAAITGSLTMEDPPPALYGQIMAKLRPEKKRQRVSRLMQYRPALAGAACFVILLGAILLLRGPSGKGSGAPESTASSLYVAAEIPAAGAAAAQAAPKAAPEPAPAPAAGGAAADASNADAGVLYDAREYSAVPENVEATEETPAEETGETENSAAQSNAPAANALRVEVVDVRGVSFTARVVSDPIGIFPEGQNLTVISDGQAAGLRPGDIAALRDYTLTLTNGEPVLTVSAVERVEN